MVTPLCSLKGIEEVLEIGEIKTCKYIQASWHITLVIWESYFQNSCGLKEGIASNLWLVRKMM